MRKQLQLQEQGWGYASPTVSGIASSSNSSQTRSRDMDSDCWSKAGFRPTLQNSHLVNHGSSQHIHRGKTIFSLQKEDRPVYPSVFTCQFAHLVSFPLEPYPNPCQPGVLSAGHLPTSSNAGRGQSWTLNWGKMTTKALHWSIPCKFHCFLGWVLGFG